MTFKNMAFKIKYTATKNTPYAYIMVISNFSCVF